MTWILTAAGKQFDLADPMPSAIALDDIAMALGKQCRFNGHCRDFYSVAEHCVHVARVLKAQGQDLATQMAGLLHDAHEAYMGDIVSPLKEWLNVKSPIGYRALRTLASDIQTAIEGAITRDEWGMHNSEAVHRADLILLATEKRDLLPEDKTPWPCLEGIEPLPVDDYRRADGSKPAFERQRYVRCWDWFSAETMWLAEYTRLSRELNTQCQGEAA